MFWRFVLRVCAVFRFNDEGVLGLERDGMIVEAAMKIGFCAFGKFTKIRKKFWFVQAKYKLSLSEAGRLE